MNFYVERAVSLLKSVRGITVTPFIAEGTDGRLYVQVVGIAGFPVFTVKRSGAYELPFEHTYTNVDMRKRGWSIVEGESEGLNAALFADQLAARPRNRHDLCSGPNYVPYDRNLSHVSGRWRHRPTQKSLGESG